MSRTLSIIVPAYNEEENIGTTLDGILIACEGLRDDYEIVVVNDCSRDRTAAIVEERSRRNPRIRLANNERNLGFGGAFMRGIQEARMEYSVMVCADNSITPECLARVFSSVGEADLVTSYVSNTEVRELNRRIISRTFVILINLLTGFRLRYYNGINVYPTAPLKKMKVSQGFAYAAEIIVHLLNRGFGYVEVPYVTRRRDKGTTSAFRFKNVVSVAKVVLQIAVHGRSRYWNRGAKAEKSGNQRAA
jgi:glycosyltransferase involved in cell wall biosynthesis